jgi:hypothetical protein
MDDVFLTGKQALVKDAEATTSNKRTNIIYSYIITMEGMVVMMFDSSSFHIL